MGRITISGIITVTSEIVRSLMGGYAFAQGGIFHKIFLLCLWCFLLCLPFTIYLTSSSSITMWYLNCIVIGIVFIIIKFINYGLHYFLDLDDFTHMGITVTTTICNNLDQSSNHQSGIINAVSDQIVEYIDEEEHDVTSEDSTVYSSSHHSQMTVHVIHQVKFQIFGIPITVPLNRLKLLALLDRNQNVLEMLLSIIFAVSVSVFGSVLLHFHFHDGFSAFMFCFIMAGCQFSLIKSVQPDPASPIHGFNWIITYSRPFYFCLLSGVILLFQNDDFFTKFLLFFPIFFFLGLFPQIPTLFFCTFEQIEIHIFGGTATTCLSNTFYCILRSILAVIQISTLAYFSESPSSWSFSGFCAILVGYSYYLTTDDLRKIVLAILIAIFVFIVHFIGIFTAEIGVIPLIVSTILGWILHYFMPLLRKHFNCSFDNLYVYLCFIERNLVFPFLFLSVFTRDSPEIQNRFGDIVGSLIITVCGMKFLRNCYTNQNSQYFIFIFTFLFLRFDYSCLNLTFLEGYFFISIIYDKVCEFLLKLYCASAILLDADYWLNHWGEIGWLRWVLLLPIWTIIVSTFFCGPILPVFGFNFYLMSHPRPVKFWEYLNTDTPFSLHYVEVDDNDFNSFVYESLGKSLEAVLCRDLMMGKWGVVNRGDFFLLLTDYPNFCCMVHIIGMGNGWVTFQIRGDELERTSCHHDELCAVMEAKISKFPQNWKKSWDIISLDYQLETYGISKVRMRRTLEDLEMTKALISCYVKSIIFYTIRSPKLEKWLTSKSIEEALAPLTSDGYVDDDVIFISQLNEDFDFYKKGMTLDKFTEVYGDWIQFCCEKSRCESRPFLKVFCFALSLLGVRILYLSDLNFNNLFCGIYDLFRGKYCISSPKDSWVFNDETIMEHVIIPSVKMALKLHQDYFVLLENNEKLPVLFDSICDENSFISYESDPNCGPKIADGISQLLILKRAQLQRLKPDSYEYEIIKANKCLVNWRVVKLNREFVRGFWANQQLELIYFRCRMDERWSAQESVNLLRNMLTSLCDPPLGYPIYISPVMKSYAESDKIYSNLFNFNNNSTQRNDIYELPTLQQTLAL